MKLQLSKNLKLISVQENNYQNGKLLAVVCYFTFFDEEGVAYIGTDKLDNEHPSFGMTEIASELSDSFNELIEDNWYKIASKCKEYVEEWKLENAD